MGQGIGRWEFPGRAAEGLSRQRVPSKEGCCFFSLSLSFQAREERSSQRREAWATADTWILGVAGGQAAARVIEPWPQKPISSQSGRTGELWRQG